MLRFLVFLAVATAYGLSIFRQMEKGDERLSATELENVFVSSAPPSSLSLLMARQNTPNEPEHASTINGTSLPFPGIPFSKQNWHGILKPNYTNLYLNYTEPVYCIRTWKPIGLYGYATWLAALVVLTQDFLDTFRLRNISFFSILANLANVIFFLISVARGFKAYQSCAKRVQAVGGLYIVDGEKVTHKSNSFAFIFLAGPFIIDWVNLFVQSVHLVIGPCLENHSCPALTVLVLKGLALLATIFIPILFYIGYTNFLYVDSSMGGPLACLVAIIVVLLIGVVLYLTLKFGGDVLGIVFNFWGFVISLALLFHIVCVGISYILLGRTIDDPWGTTSATGPLGIIQAVADGVIPLITTLASLALGGQ